jgi:hypothetical protein
MAIKAQITSNLDWLDDAIAVMEELPAVIAIAGDEALSDIEDDFLRELQQEPGPTGTPKRKIKWTTRLQQQAYFASNGFGGGIPTKRTGKLAAAWKITGKLVGKSWVVLVSNPAKAARFVYGSLAISNVARAARFQQGFHATTGWKLAAPIVIKWFEEYQKRFQANMNILIGEMGTPKFKRRGITPRLSKRRRK